MASPRLIMKTVVEDVRIDGGDVLVVTFRHPRKPRLPDFTPGAHIDVHLADGRVRQYSLCGDPADPSVYRIAVKLEHEGRGGSTWLHRNLVPGAVVPVAAPRNHFPLRVDGARYILLAGGIGITPLITMAHALGRVGKPYELHYFARSRAAAPLLHEIRDALDPKSVALHLSDEPRTRASLDEILTECAPGTQVYCCGPARFMDGVRKAAGTWPEGTVHFEAFQPLVDDSSVPEPFELMLRSTGAVIPVPADKSALQVLRETGILLQSSCEIGTCGTCECGYLDGTPIHRDVVLSPMQRKDRFMPCVSRASGRIRLDL